MIYDLNIINELNELWEPIYPLLADHVVDVSGLTGGRILELGPFSGGIAVELLRRWPQARALVLTHLAAQRTWATHYGRKAGTQARLACIPAAIDHLPIRPRSVDLVVVRGAFFFLDPNLLRTVESVLAPGGFGWVGGGYGREAPPSVIEPMARRSKELNEAIGKRWVSAEAAGDMICRSGITSARVSTEGGLWIEIRG